MKDATSQLRFYELSSSPQSIPAELKKVGCMIRNHRYVSLGPLACIIVLFLYSVVSLAHGQVRHLVSLADLASLKYLYWQMEVSPNEKTLAYVVDEEDSLWLVDTKGGISRRIGQGTMPRWSPDSSRLAFYSTRSGELQLWVLDLRTGNSIQITDIEGGINPDAVARFTGWGDDPLRYCWSPDGRRIAFTSQVKAEGPTNLQAARAIAQGRVNSASDNHLEEEASPLVLTNTTPPAWMLIGLFRADELGIRYINGTFTGEGDANSNGKPSQVSTNQMFIVDVASKKVEVLTEDDQGYLTPNWSPDGTKIVCVSTEGKPLVGYGPDTSNLYVIDVTTRRKTALTTGGGQKRLPVWSPDGKLIAYQGGTQFRMSSVYVLASTGGDPVKATTQVERDVWMCCYWSPDGASLFVSFRDGVMLPVSRIRIADGKVQRLTEPGVSCIPFTVSRLGTLVCARQDGSSVTVLYAADSDGHNAHVVLDLNPQIKQWAVGEQEIIRWKNSRGDEMEGILIKPAYYHEGKRYPLIVDPYPGLTYGLMSDPMLGNQAFASKGYAVFFPRERTAHTWQNADKDEAFNLATRGPQGADIMMDDLMTGIDMVVKRGVADPDRMCLYGFSNGGAATNLIVTRTSRFKCAASASGASDWSSAFFLNNGPNVFADLLGGVTPWEDPSVYVTLSPIYHLDKVVTPMLLAVGDKENLGTLFLAEMYNGLRYLGRDVTFVRYPKQGHGFEGASLRDYWQRVNAFFDRYLKPE
jgi:dipeptidyl aminopeptidase/acylaminoacyl peptidase